MFGACIRAGGAAAPDTATSSSDPATAEKLANGMEALSGALLNLKVGDVRAAVEGRKRDSGRTNLTVGDLARREDPEFRAPSPAADRDAKPKIEQSIKALNQALPEITSDLVERARQSIERAMPRTMPDPNYPTIARSVAMAVD